MKIGVWQLDGNFPNYALMKISMYHKLKNDEVEHYKGPIFRNQYDKVYTSSVFTYTDKSYINNTIYGGSGVDVNIKLPQYIDDLDPDYSLYPNYKKVIGYLTRGCTRKCKECIVPEKEGWIAPYRDIEQIAIRKEVVLFDNNILACDYGIKQIEKIGKMNIKVDFNQGLDCRLIDNTIAKLLSKVKWLVPLRMACDNINMIKPVLKATELLRKNNCNPKQYSIYVLAKDLESTLERTKILKKNNLSPFVQPYISKNGKKPDNILIELARYTNMKQYFKKMSFNQWLLIRKGNKNIIDINSEKINFK